MSLYSAMRSGVSGMSAQSSRLAAISDNISNSQTVGYKRATVDFSTLLTSPGSSVYSAGGVQSSTRYQLGQDGTPIGTTSATDMAISGNGFFVVGNNSSGSPQYSLTRAGSFEPDDSGFLRNTAGQYLEAWKLAPDGSLPGVSTTRFDDLEPVNVGNLLYGGSRTTQMEFSGNLPAQAAVGTSFTTTTSFYDGLGNPLDIGLTWKKTVDGNPGDPSAVPPVAATMAQWEVSVSSLPAGYTVTDPITTPLATQTVSIASTGPYAGLPVDGTGNPATIPSFSITSAAVPTSDTFTLGFGNTTQLNGDYVPQVTSDGSKVGRVSTVNIDETGKLWVVYDNGARQALYQIPVANVVNPNGLVAQSGNTFTLGMDAGPLSLSRGNSAGAGSVIGGALEQSNVDIATELVSLIETQRAYSSNATIVRTADEMVDETNRLKR